MGTFIQVEMLLLLLVYEKIDFSFLNFLSDSGSGFSPEVFEWPTFQKQVGERRGLKILNLGISKFLRNTPLVKYVYRGAATSG